MILWCKKCHKPIAYSVSAAFSHRFFNSQTDQPTCLPCSIALLDARNASDQQKHSDNTSVRYYPNDNVGLTDGA